MYGNTPTRQFDPRKWLSDFCSHPPNLAVSSSSAANEPQPAADRGEYGRAGPLISATKREVSY